MYLQKFLFLSFLICLVGCEASWTQSKILDASYPQIWDVSNEIIDKLYKTYTSDENKGSIDSQWKFELSPFMDTGLRYMAKLKIERYMDKDEESVELEQKPDTGVKWHYVVKVRVARERNESMMKTDDPQTAFWLPDGFDSTQERICVHLIEAKLGAYADWIYSKTFRISYEALWNSLLGIIDTHYKVEYSDKYRGIIESSWQEEFSPSSDLHYRQKALTEIVRWDKGKSKFVSLEGKTEESEGEYAIKVQVLRQKDELLKKDEKEDESEDTGKTIGWVSDGRVSSKETVLIQIIEEKLAKYIKK